MKLAILVTALFMLVSSMPMVAQAQEHPLDQPQILLSVEPIPRSEPFQFKLSTYASNYDTDLGGVELSITANPQEGLTISGNNRLIPSSGWVMITVAQDPNYDGPWELTFQAVKDGFEPALVKARLFQGEILQAVGEDPAASEVSVRCRATSGDRRRLELVRPSRGFMRPSWH